MTTPQPPPPPLRKEIEDLVFTHKSLVPREKNLIDDYEDPKDWERVAFLGEGILVTAMSRVLYYAYPKRRTNALKPSRTQMLSKDTLASITDAYRLTERMRCLEANRQDIAMSLDTRAALAESFVGGLVLQYGVTVATQWAAEMLAWKHGLAVPPSDEQRLKSGAAVSTSPPPPPPPTAVSPAPPPGPGPTYGRPAWSSGPRPEHPQFRPPQEAPVPAVEYEPPYAQYVYGHHQSMYQGGASYPQMPGLVAATPPTNYHPAPAYPHPSASRPLPQLPYMQAPGSPPCATPFPQQSPQQVDYSLNFSYSSPSAAPPSFADSVNYQHPPPQAAATPQPQFQAQVKTIPVWGPQVPGAAAIPYGAPSPSGPKAILDMGK